MDTVVAEEEDAAAAAAAGMDFVERLGPDGSAVVFAVLHDPADLARAAAVSRSWRTLVMAVHLGKIQCLRLFPEVASFTRIEQPTTSAGSSNNGANEEDAGSTAAATAWENHKREQRVYMHLAHALLSAGSSNNGANDMHLAHALLSAGSSNNGANEEDAGSTAGETAWENHKREQRAYMHLAHALLSAGSSNNGANDMNLAHALLSAGSSNNGANEEDAGLTAAATAWENYMREPRAYMHHAHALLSRTTKKSCIAHCIGASSTDNFPNQRIENTLEPQDHLYMGPQDQLLVFGQENHFNFGPGEHMYHWPVFWSSSGQEDPGVPEFLVYKLRSDLCVIDEIRIQPFRAYFQPHKPIYSAQYVRFKFGCPKSPLQPEDLVSFNYEEGQMIADDNNMWTYTSPEFPILQENVLQSFKLPRPVLCIGGMVKVELLGRIQKQEADDLYYICINYVQVLGTPLPQEFGAGPCENGIALKYVLDHESPGDSGCSESKWHDFEARIWRELKVTGQGIGFNQELLSRLLGPSLQFAVEENGHGESKEVTRPLP